MSLSGQIAINEADEKLFYRGPGGTVYSVNLANLRALGTAANQNTGTSGANVPLLSAANTWSASQSITGDLTASGSVVTSLTRSSTYRFYNPGLGTDLKYWDWFVNPTTGDIAFRAVNDAFSAANTAIQLSRTGYTIGTMIVTPPLSIRGGLNFNNYVASVYNDLTYGITLYTGYGFCITNATLNYNSGGYHDFYTGNTKVARLHSSGVDWLSLETTVASAATTDIGSTPSHRALISGTTTITSFGTVANRQRFVRFGGSLTLTHNATSLQLPGDRNIVTAAGDTMIATSDASGNWIVTNYLRADGTPLAANDFEAAYVWNFEAMEGWSVGGATSAISGSVITVTSTSADPTLLSPSTLAIDGSRHTMVRARIRRTAGSAWDGSLFYVNGNHGLSGSYRGTMPNPASAGWQIVEWDMSALDWTSGPVTQIRLDLGSASGDVFDVDWIAVGRYTESQAVFTNEVTVASAATCDIGNAYSQCVAISGSTTITSFGAGANKMRFVRFGAALTLTYNATSLILPGSANVAVRAGDTCVAQSDGSGNWRVSNFQRADGTALVSSPVRTRLTADTTYYVRSDGSDSNTGLTNSSGGAFATLQGAINLIHNGVDLAGFTATVQLAGATPSTFAGGVTVIGPFVGAAGMTPVRILGDTTTPGNFTLSTSSGDVIHAEGGANLVVSGVTLTSTSGAGILAMYDSVVTVDGPIVFGSVPTSQPQIFAARGGKVIISSAYTISGGAGWHWRSNFPGSTIIAAAAGGFAVTLSGTPAFSNAFANTMQGGGINCSGTTYSGGAAGQYYNCTIQSFINSGGATLPGNAAGSTDATSVYL